MCLLSLNCRDKSRHQDYQLLESSVGIIQLTTWFQSRFEITSIRVTVTIPIIFTSGTSFDCKQLLLLSWSGLEQGGYCDLAQYLVKQVEWISTFDNNPVFFYNKSKNVPGLDACSNPTKIISQFFSTDLHWSLFVWLSCRIIIWYMVVWRI